MMILGGQLLVKRGEAIFLLRYFVTFPNRCEITPALERKQNNPFWMYLRSAISCWPILSAAWQQKRLAGSAARLSPTSFETLAAPTSEVDRPTPPASRYTLAPTELVRPACPANGARLPGRLIWQLGHGRTPHRLDAIDPTRSRSARSGCGKNSRGDDGGAEKNEASHDDPNASPPIDPTLHHQQSEAGHSDNGDELRDGAEQKPLQPIH